MNSSIEIMVVEHEYIMRLIKVIRQVSLNIFNGEQVDCDDFEEIIDFIRNFADKHHHEKEEKFLFVEMKKNIGPVADKLITHGMLVEHDLGRLYINDAHIALEKVRQGDDDSKLDLVANVMNYGYLLIRHIEEESKEKGIQKHYISILHRLEEKYL